MLASHRLAVVPSWNTTVLFELTNRSSLKGYKKTLLQTAGKIFESNISLNSPSLSHLFERVFNL